MDPLYDLLIRHGVFVVFAATLAARLGLPLPASPLLVLAGGLAAGGAIGWPAALAAGAAAVVGDLLGAQAWYLGGRRHGYRIMRLLCRISISPDSCVRRSEVLIVRWGGVSLVASQFLPGLSMVAAPMAGALRMSPTRFVVFEIAGASAHVAVYMALGAVFHRQLAFILAAMSAAGGYAVAALALALLVFVAVRWLRRRRAREAMTMPRIEAEELRALFDEGADVVVVDVRTEAGRAADPDAIPGAIALGSNFARPEWLALPRSHEIVLYCNCPNEVSAALAARHLLSNGYPKARPLAGGLDAWRALGPAPARAVPAEAETEEAASVVGAGAAPAVSPSS